MRARWLLGEYADTDFRLTRAQRRVVLRPVQQGADDTRTAVAVLLAEVRERGDAALR